MIIEAGSYSLEQCFVQFKLTAHGYSPLRYRSVWRSNSEMYMVSCRTVSKMEIVMSYSRISPRLAISLLILIFLLIPFRQSCRIGYNVRDQLQIAHIVAKVFLFQALEVLVLSIAHPRPCARDLVRENRVLSALCTPCLRHSSVNSLRMRIASSR